MSSRDTRTGGVLEAMVLPALAKGGYTVQTQVLIGSRPGGGKHNVDAVASKEGKSFLISLKWQQVNGTAEQKVPFELICLMDAVLRYELYSKAYLVLGGNSWKLREFYVSGGLKEYLNHTETVSIVKFEDFVALANYSKL